MTKYKAILCAILMGITFSIFSPLCVSAQEKESEKPLRPVTSVFTVELGRQSALDTYLTLMITSFFNREYPASECVSVNPYSSPSIPLITSFPSEDGLN